MDLPLSESYNGHPLPDITRRGKTYSCIGETSQAGRQANKTHHFHYYKAAVDASKITVPLKRADWEHHSRTKPQRRQAVPMDPHEPEGELLDLYVCCQCSLYCVVSGVIPGVIPQRTFEAFIKERLDHPQVGKTPPVSLGVALVTLLK
jgi:ubiquitin carboxyl-terminal hydrolase 25/28